MEGKVTPSPAPITHRQARMTYTDSVDAATGVKMVKMDHTTTPNPRMSFAVNLVARYPPHMFVTVYPTKKMLQATAPGQQALQ